MGSLTEEQLLQMVQDFIEFESAEAVASENHKPRGLTLQEILWEVTDIEVEILEKILKYAADEGSTSTSTANLKKLMVMKLRIDGYEASLCTTSWLSSFDGPKVLQFRGGYEYIDVMEKNTRVIIDMDFRSEFELARPTEAYKELTDMLPSIFVGSEGKLKKIICVICSAAKKSMKEKGLHIPPWRKATYMQSKWLSQHCKKISFTPTPTQFAIGPKHVQSFSPSI
ncbi:Protein transport protein [Senna tora]|uniref:Protein transport protein n=1 Tax=Senna tora TaxID=362788 RepID=A0A834TYM8_9FABA|nr:Protein transport protein [Senna tora]